MNRLAIFLALLAVTGLTAVGQVPVRVAAAADLKFALDSVAHAFEQQSGTKLDIIYGSSGKLFEQISNGAPFDIFFSADIAYPNRLQAKGQTASTIYAYGVGRIVVWSKRLDPSTSGMAVLADPSVRKVAIANPTHAPYGKRAAESLQYYQLWATVEDRLVYGENIAQTAQFVTTGAADVGIIALSLALAPNMVGLGGHYYLIPTESHEPLVQGAVITRHGNDNETAVAFFQFTQTSRAAAILQHYGFSKPE